MMRFLKTLVVVAFTVACSGEWDEEIRDTTTSDNHDGGVADGGGATDGGGGNTDANCASNGQCANGVACVRYADCQSRICDKAVCAAPLVVTPDAGLADAGPVDGGVDGGVNNTPTATCSDNAVNQTESDTDCGGTCNSCADGKMCVASSDCASGRCNAGVCEAVINPPAPTCSDGARNGTETDVDCGGTCNSCADGKMCVASSDCASGRCNAGVCEAVINPPAPTCSDGARNGTETDIDCGGTCSACANGKMCVASSDCASGRCNAGVCEASPTNVAPSVTAWATVGDGKAYIHWSAVGFTGSVTDVKVWSGVNGIFGWYNNQDPVHEAEGTYTITLDTTPHDFKVDVCFDGRCFTSNQGVYGVGVSPLEPPKPLSDQMYPGGAFCDTHKMCASKVCSRSVCQEVSASPYPPGVVAVRCRQARDTCKVRAYSKTLPGFYELQYNGTYTLSANSQEGKEVLLVQDAICTFPMMAPEYEEIFLYGGYITSPYDAHISYAEVVLPSGVKVWGSWSRANGSLAAVLRSWVCQ